MAAPVEAQQDRARTPSWQVERLERDPPPGWKVERNYSTFGDRRPIERRDYDKWDCHVDAVNRAIRCDK
jgi:hypothetical protein